MNFTYENQGVNTYLVYKLSEDEKLDNMGLGMLTNNKIPGFAPVFYTQLNSDKYIKYNVSAKDSVNRFFKGAVNKKRLLNVFLNIVKSLLSAEDYMLDYADIMLDVDYIFVDVSTLETYLVCLPVHTDKPFTELKAFFKEIVSNTQFDQTENCDYVTKILNFLNSSPQLSLPDFKILLEKLNTEDQIKIPGSTATTVVVTPSQGTVKVVRPEENTIVTQIVPQPAVPITPQPVVPQPVSQHAVPVIPQPVSQPQPELQTEETEKMSLYYLLTHFDKANMQTYKSQRASDKEKEGKTDKKKNKKEEIPGKVKAGGAPGFAIPGGKENKPSVPPVTHVPPAGAIPSVKPQVVTQVRPTQTPPPQNPGNTFVQIPGTTMQVKGGGYGETTVLSAVTPGQTTVLSVNPAAKKLITPHLIRISNNEKISLNKPTFRIGRERSYVDYFISDNSAVSGIHADFEISEDRYYIIDINSTNHTYLNGEMIHSSIKVEIKHGDKIRLANEEFEFKLY